MFTHKVFAQTLFQTCTHSSYFYRKHCNSSYMLQLCCYGNSVHKILTVILIAVIWLVGCSCSVVIDVLMCWLLILIMWGCCVILGSRLGGRSLLYHTQRGITWQLTIWTTHSKYTNLSIDHRKWTRSKLHSQSLCLHTVDHWKYIYTVNIVNCHCIGKSVFIDHRNWVDR